MMFKSGAGVEVLENKHYMAARVYLPWEFIVSLFSRKRAWKCIAQCSSKNSSIDAKIVQLFVSILKILVEYIHNR